MMRPRLIAAAAFLAVTPMTLAADECAEPVRVYLETWNLLWHDDYNDYVTVEILVPSGSQQFTFAATTAPADIVATLNWMGFHLGWHAQVYSAEFVEVASTAAGPDDFIAIRQSASIDNTPIACAQPDAATCSDWAMAYAVPAPLGDLDCDGVVGVADLLLLLAAWGECAIECPADLNGDGHVGIDDLPMLLGNWG